MALIQSHAVAAKPYNSTWPPNRGDVSHLGPDVDGDGLGLKALVEPVGSGPVAPRAEVELRVLDEALPVVHLARDVVARVLVQLLSQLQRSHQKPVRRMPQLARG